MIVLHAAFLDSQVHLWGERSTESLDSRGPHSSGKLKESLPKDLPNQAGAHELSTALSEAALSFKVKTADSHAVIWLPTVENRPVPSSPIIGEQPGPEVKAVLAPWRVATFPLPTDHLLELLSACVDREVLTRGVMAGKDLGFWTTAMRFAGALLARQQFLPGIVKEDGICRARWNPVFVGIESDRLVQLARIMPSACWALSRDPVSPPQVSAVWLLSNFVGEIIDHLVRSGFSTQSSSTSLTATGRTETPVFDSIHDQWLYALRSRDGQIPGDTAELAKIWSEFQEWRRSLSISTATPFRLCFRLEEPTANRQDGRDQTRAEAWQVRYLLQAADDPSLLIPVRDGWNPKGRTATLLARGAFNGREYLLSALGQASRICPRIEESLRVPAPEGYELDSAGAHEFLTEKAWALEQSGFGVLLPAWWTRRGTKLRLTARAQVKSPRMQGGSGLSLDSLIQFNWEVALGEETLSREELEMLARLKVPLVKVRGQWVQLNGEEIQAALAFWKKQASSQVTGREILRMALGAAVPPGGISFAGVKASGWIADLLKQLEGEAKFEETPVPAGFNGILRPYQMRGYSWLCFLQKWGLGACLADDMGLGKTIQTLALIERNWESNGRRPALLICPTSVTGNWYKEASRFTPNLPVMVHHGIKRERGAAFRNLAAKQAMVISSYSLLHRDIGVLQEVSWAGVFLDEAQNIKNPETKQAGAARSLRADYRAALTGTPVENNVGDLWSLMEFLNPGLLGTQAEFKRTFFLPIQTSRDPEAIERLKRLTGPFILRRLKTDKTIIRDLPEKMEMKVFCTLTKEQASLYEAVVKEASHELESSKGIQRKGVVLATLSKLKQVCNHPAQFLGDNSAIAGRSGKLARLTEMLEEILQIGDRALIFSQFSEMGEILRKHLQETLGQEVLFLHGAVPKKRRDPMLERFQSEEGPGLFVLSLKAGGTGLNLMRANHVFHFDRWWNPAVENQATDRVFRIGQTKNVQVHKFLCAGTLEEKIDEMIERKQEIAANVIGSGEGWLTELSTAELKQIFALRQDAVGE